MQPGESPWPSLNLTLHQQMERVIIRRVAFEVKVKVRGWRTFPINTQTADLSGFVAYTN